MTPITVPADAPRVGIIGAGSVGTALGVAISRAGWPVTAVASRDARRRERFAALVPGAMAYAEAPAILDAVELIVVSVPDDAISAVAGSMRLFAGQTMVHTSGLLGAGVLSASLGAGSHIGAFHPLVSFTADVERSVAGLSGATVAVEGDDVTVGLLADLAEAIGGVPVRLPAGAQGGLSRGGGPGLGRSHRPARRRRCPRCRGRPRRAGSGRRLRPPDGADPRQRPSRRCAAALTGPITRGDAGTVTAHLEALARFAPEVVDLYLAAARRELVIAEERAPWHRTAGTCPEPRLQRSSDRVRLGTCSTASRRSTRPGPLPDSCAPPAASGSGVSVSIRASLSSARQPG
jgi:predicted short-subunit dehydrogenase-like oxidoreductase (DUF2520 family)